MIRGETQYNPVSRFVKEIPEKLLDNKLPTIKRWSDEDYDDASRERSFFKAKPFQTSKPALSDTVFDKPKNNWEMAENYNTSNSTVKKNNWQGADSVMSGNRIVTAGSTGTSGIRQTASRSKTATDSGASSKKDISSIIASKPKAVIKKKETPAANKPYIAKSLDGLTKGMPSTAPGGPGYGAGDRVRHIKYGEGTVLKIEQEPKDYKVTVKFDLAGNKIMYAAFAKLKKI